MHKKKSYNTVQKPELQKNIRVGLKLRKERKKQNRSSRLPPITASCPAGTLFTLVFPILIGVVSPALLAGASTRTDRFCRLGFGDLPAFRASFGSNY